MSAQAFVLDASVTAAWLLPDERTPASWNAYDRLRAAALEAHVPDLWLWECGNIIASAVKRRRLDASDALLAWSALDALRSRVELTLLKPAQVRACLVIGIDQGLSIYDSSYLWLAQSRALPLLTHDERLAGAAERVGVAVLGVEQVG